VWNGEAFTLSGTAMRVLAYEVGKSGWSDELTELHESATGSGTHFIDLASRRHAIRELKRTLGAKPASIMEIGCSAGHLLADMRRSLPNAALTGGDYTLGTLVRLGEKMPNVPLVRNFIDSYVKQLAVDLKVPELPLKLKLQKVQPTPAGLLVTFGANEVPLNAGGL